MFKFFDTVDNVKMQIQNKRRKNTFGGMFGSSINLFGNQGGNNQGWNQNNGWGEEGGWGNNNGWSQQQGGWGGGQNPGQMGLEMALFGNKELWGNNVSGYDWVQLQSKLQQYILVDPNKQSSSVFDDISDIIHKQVVFLEPSPAEKRLQQLKKEGKAFYDDRFPPNQDSLSGQWGPVSEWASIQWKRCSQVMPSSLIFRDKVEPGDIKQGYLGDCYFLAGLAALAERPDRIFNLFLLKQTNSVRYFSVKMLYKGKWMTIDMDEHIPCLSGKPAFSKANENQLWVILLEKAWAKLYTSYKRIEAGYPQQALHDLTGAPIRNILMKQAGFNKQAEWNYLVSASQKEYSMVASSRPGSDRNKSQSGIVQGHAYTFLNATVLNYNGGSQRIVQLRNPWGKGESKGKWCDTDPNWNRVPPSQMQRIGFNKNGEDGIFFMTYDAFIDEFRALTVAEINDNASYVYKSMKDINSEGVYFKIQIAQSGYYSLHVDKTPERSFEDKMQNLYNYPETRIDVGCIQGNSCQKLESFVSAKRTLFRGYQLNPGVYVVFVKISFNSSFEKDFDVNLAVYSEFACDIEIAPRDLVVKYTGNPNVKWNPALHQSKGAWNDLGNSRYQRGDSGWGNYNSNDNNNNNNGGWGNDNGWGDNGGGGGNNNGGWGNDNGWGNSHQGQQGGNSNNGWGNTNQGGNGSNGWGDSGGFEKKGNDDGWGNTHSNPKKSDNGWGSSHNSGNGWGGTSPSNDNGWGPVSSSKGPTYHGNNDNGWGNPPSNNGWGNGW